VEIVQVEIVLPGIGRVGIGRRMIAIGRMREIAATARVGTGAKAAVRWERVRTMARRISNWKS
jgi:hypothetical protein